VRDVVNDVVFTEGAPGLISVGALLALWAGSNVFSALIDALNKAYDIEESRPYWKKKLIAMASVVVVGGTIAVATTVLLAGEHIARWVTDQLGLDRGAAATIMAVQIIIAFALLVGLAWLSFYFLPNLHQSKRHVLAGALVTTVLWVVVTLVFRFYVQNFGAYNKTYGTIGGVIVLLTWMYLSMLVFLVGGELNSELHKGTGAIASRRGLLFGGRIETAEAAGAVSTDRIERVGPLGAGSS
jgi:membrane protein